MDDKTTKISTDKVELFTESVDRYLGIQCNNFDATNFNEINQFVENISKVPDFLANISQSKSTNGHLFRLSQQVWKASTEANVSLFLSLKSKSL